MVIKYFLNNYNYLKALSYNEITKLLKEFSNKIIYTESFDEEILKIKYFKTFWTDIDLFCYWSKMLRISKKISLKSLGIQLNYPIVQELPFKPDSILKKEDLPKLRYYNYTHDLGILELLTKKLEEDIKLRDYIQQEYNLTCWSMDAPKIASEYLLEYYCQKTYLGKVPYYQYKKNIRETKYFPSIWKIGDYLPEVNFKTDFFKEINHNIRESFSNNPFSKLIPFFQKEHSVMLSVSKGGIHSVNNNQSYFETDEYYLIDADVTGLEV